MGEVYFYHLTDTPLERTLPSLLPRALAQGWRVEVRGVTPARMDWLDQALWLGAEEGFLPHGLAGGTQDALQPVLLTNAPAGPGFACLMAVDGADVSAEEAQVLDRTCILFDGNDEVAKAQARAQWRDLTGAGLGAKYWAQEDGAWVMKQAKAAMA
jgi:DNA polymerase III subunit chi